jgi:hypothetical protein
MLTPGRLYPNTSLRLTIAFRDDDGVLVDPTTVTFKTFDPCCNFVEYVYGTDSEITKLATGRYAADIVPGVSGRWCYVWQTTGAGTTLATEGDFLVQESPWSADVFGCCDYS